MANQTYGQDKLKIIFDTDHNAIDLTDEEQRLRLFNSHPDFIFLEEALVEEGTTIEILENSTKIKLGEIEPEVDYTLKILEVTFSEVDDDYSIERRTILEFDPEEQYVIIDRPFERDLTAERYEITYNIKEKELEGLFEENYIEYTSGSGYNFSFNTLKEGERGIELRTPTNKFIMHEATETSVEGNRFSYKDAFIGFTSANYSQLHANKEEGAAHEDRRGYTFGVYNADYLDETNTEQVHNQGVVLLTPKHAFRIIDTSGLGEDMTLVKEQYVEYSSLDGNYFKLIANTSIGSALYFQTKEGHQLNWDDSFMTFQQHKTFDKENLVPADADGGTELPVNYLNFDKTENTENIVLSSHNITNYADIYNEIKLSETDSNAVMMLSNQALEGVKNTIELNTETKTIKLENTFTDGKMNIVEMTEDLIKISTAEDKTVIELTPEGISVVSEGETNLKIDGDVNVEASGDAKVKGTNVEVDGKITLKSGDAAAWAPNTIPACLFTGAPHGGSTAGIINLKGA